MSENVEVVKLLIDAGVDIDVRNNINATPLVEISDLGNVKIVDLLLDAGADIDAQDKDGATPLMAAIYRNHHEIVEMLIKGGADPYIKSKDGIDAFDQAKNDSDKRMFEILKANNKDRNKHSGPSPAR